MGSQGVIYALAGMKQPVTPPKTGLAARRVAVRILWGVLEEHKQLSDLTGDLDALEPADRARAQRLATETLRHLGRCDALLDPHMKKRPPVAALNVLRLAVLELCHDKAAAHGVVDSAVTLMRKIPKSRPYTGLANAVLRKVAETGPEAWDALPPSELRKWLRRRLVHIFDEDTTQAIEVAHAKGAPTDVTVKENPQDWAEKLGGTVLPTGSVRLPERVQISELPGYGPGAWWVQDAAAALPVKLLGAKPGEKVLDLCAAPGGKTLQLASIGAEVTALDKSNARVERIRENLRRTALNAEIVVADALKADPQAQFDAVLLDAPCTATGTIRRHPDLPFAKTGRDLDPLFQLQADLFDRAVAWLKPGGRMVYCTCSLLPEEGERQVKQAMARHDLEILSDLPEGVPEDWRTEDGGLRTRPDLWPEYGGLDGFYLCLLRKK